MQTPESTCNLKFTIAESEVFYQSMIEPNFSSPKYLSMLHMYYIILLFY